MRHVHLDPVGSVVELFARGLARRDRTIYDLCALGHLQLRRIAFQRISSRSRDGPRRHEEPRPGDIAALNRLLDAHITVARTLGFDVAQRGEALFQGPPGCDRSPRRTHR